MLKRLLEFDSLESWIRAKDFISSIHDRDKYTGVLWPETLGILQLASIQGMGNKSSTQAWEAKLILSSIPTHDEEWESTMYLLGTPITIKHVEHLVIYPADFAEFLQQHQLKPSELILAWFKAFDVVFEQNGEGDDSDDEETSGERPFTTWLRKIWKKEGRPTGKALFGSLKKYVKQPDSPILEHYTTSAKGPGIMYRGKNKPLPMTMKNIQSKASEFKAEEMQKAVKEINQ